MTDSIAAPQTSLSGGINVLTPVSYAPPDDHLYEDWIDDGRRFENVRRSLLWWIGDWFSFGERFGEQIYQGIDDCGYEQDTITDALRVCKAWPAEDRCPELSYNHHRLLVTTPVEERGTWIASALDLGWSCKDLREELQRTRRLKSLEDMTSAEENHIVIYCPPYGDGEVKGLPKFNMAKDSLLLLVCFGSRVEQGVVDLKDEGYRVGSTIVLRPPVHSPEPRDRHWVSADASFILVGIRGDIREPLPDELPGQFPSSLFDLGVQLDRAYPHLRKATALIDLNHPAFSSLTLPDSPDTSH